MSIDKNFVMHAMRIIYGEFVLKSDEADELVKLLGSREEFLSWILFRRGLMVDFPEIRHALEEAANAKVVTPSNRRVEDEFPFFKKNNMLEAEAAFKALLDASEKVRKEVDEANDALKFFSFHHGCGALGHLLDIKAS
jgi:hypothetical protein